MKKILLTITTIILIPTIVFGIDAIENLGSSFSIDLNGAITGNTILGTVCIDRSSSSANSECNGTGINVVRYAHAPASNVDTLFANEEVVGFVEGFAWSTARGWIEFPRVGEASLGTTAFEAGCTTETNKAFCYPRIVEETLTNGNKVLKLKGYAALIVTPISPDGTATGNIYNDYINLNNITLTRATGSSYGFRLNGIATSTAQVGNIDFTGIVANTTDSPLQPTITSTNDNPVVGETITLTYGCNDYSSPRAPVSPNSSAIDLSGTDYLNSSRSGTKDVNITVSISTLTYELQCEDELFGVSEKVTKSISTRNQAVSLIVSPEFSPSTVQTVSVTAVARVIDDNATTVSCRIYEIIPGGTDREITEVADRVFTTAIQKRTKSVELTATTTFRLRCEYTHTGRGGDPIVVEDTAKYTKTQSNIRDR